MDIKDIILFILVIIVIYLIYKTRKLEKFEAPLSDEIIAAVNDKYKIDMDALRNLAAISKNIMTNTQTLVLPADTTSAGKLTVDKDFEVGGNIKFSKKNTNSMEIFPRGMIVAWYINNRPKGWAPCDGNYYKLNNNFEAILSNEQDTDAVLTPDLRSRFIIGAHGSEGNQTYIDSRNITLLTRPFGTWGGEENVTLNINQIPSHNHVIDWSGTMCSGDDCGVQNTNDIRFGTIFDSYKQFGKRTLKAPKIFPSSTGNSGQSNAHENMPPYFSLFYYIKL